MWLTHAKGDGRHNDLHAVMRPVSLYLLPLLLSHCSMVVTACSTQSPEACVEWQGLLPSQCGTIVSHLQCKQHEYSEPHALTVQQAAQLMGKRERSARYRHFTGYDPVIWC